MRVRLVRRPGQPGTKELVEQYGERLVCVRYRYDAAAGRRYKTAEIIIESSAWAPPIAPEAIVGLRVGLLERDIQRRLRAAGGVWDKPCQLWRLRYDQALALGLADRIVEGL